MATYKLTVAADQDFEQIFEYGLDNFGLKIAIRYQNALKERFEILAENPVLYPVTELREGYRRSVCGVHSVYYCESQDGVEIIRILGRQDADGELP